MALKPNDLIEIQEFADNHPIGKILSEMRNWHFSVGDVLVRTKRMPDGAWIQDHVSETCPVPKKFRVIHIDELGIPWIRQLSVRGGMGTALTCLVNSNVELFKYKVDPEQLDSILLGIKYDPRSEYRRMRDSNPKYGGKK